MNFRIWLLLPLVLLVAVLVFRYRDSGPAMSTANQLTLAWESAPLSFDPRFAQDANSQYLEDLINCALITYDENGQLAANLAESWQWQDAQTLVLKVRKNIKFSDGSILQAADVKATYDFFLNGDAASPSPRAGAFRNVKEVKLSGDDTISFHLHAADASFPGNLVVGILPQKLVAMGQIDTPSQLIGCGPFLLAESGISRMHLVRNPNYNLAPAPKLERVTIEFVKEEQTRFAKLVKGELDLVQNMISRDKLSEIARRQPTLDILKRPGLNTTYLGFNMRDPITGNPAVRQAIAYGIDREQIIQHTLHDLARPATTLLVPGDPSLNPDLTNYQRDVAKGNALLDQAGFPRKGREPRFTLTYSTTTDATRASIARAIAGQLRELGIDVKVQTMEWGRFRNEVESGRVQMWSLSWIGFKDPDIYRFAFATENIPPNGPNRGAYSNEELDKLLAEATKTTDAEKRRALYFKIQAIVDQELPYVFLWHEDIFAVVNKAVQGFTIYADGRLSALKTASKK